MTLFMQQWSTAREILVLDSRELSSYLQWLVTRATWMVFGSLRILTIKLLVIKAFSINRTLRHY